MPLIAGLLVSTIGLGYFIYGKKMQENTFLIAGLAMMIYPYFIGNMIIMLIIGLALAASPFVIAKYY
jgi:hypothetical protein